MALWYPGRYVREDFERVSGTRSSTSVVKLISYKEGMMMKMKRLVARLAVKRAAIRPVRRGRASTIGIYGDENKR